MPNGNLAGIAHQHPEANNHQTVIGGHGQLGQIELGPGEHGQQVQPDHHQAQCGQGAIFPGLHQKSFNRAASLEPNSPWGLTNKMIRRMVIEMAS